MPAFNEAGSLDEVVRGVAEQLRASGVTFEIVIVDDGSSDGTSLIADELSMSISQVRVVHHQRHRGIGAGWRSCISESRGEWVFIQPADGQVHPATARHFFEVRRDAGAVIGVRRRWERPLYRHMLTRLFQAVTEVALGLSLPDFGLCFLFRGDLVRSFSLVSGDVGVAVVSEWLYLIRRADERSIEVPVDVLPRHFGSSKAGRLSDSVATLLDLLRVAIARRLLGH